MKLSPNEKLAINSVELFNSKLDGIITFQELAMYNMLACHAFPNQKTGERHISMLQVHQIEERLHFAYTRKKIREIISRLVQAKLIKPHYYVKTGKNYTSHDSIKVFDGPDGLGRKSIAYTKYEILQCPTEKKERKKALDKKKDK